MPVRPPRGVAAHPARLGDNARMNQATLSPTSRQARPCGTAPVAQHLRPSPGRAWPAPLLLLALLAAVAAPVQAQPVAAPLDPDEAFYQRAASCAAAMQVDQLALAARARAGETGLRPEILHITRLGFAYVGTAYQRGLRDPRGSQMLKAATAEQKSWPEPRHRALTAECMVEAQKVYDEAGSVARWFVDMKATKRVDRFLNAAAPSASAASAAASR